MKTRTTVVPMMLALLAGAFTAGCVTNDPGAPTSQLARIVADPASYLHVGMTTEQIRKAMGEPSEVRPLKSSDGHGETWIYKARIYSGENLISVKTEPRPYFDPFLGQIRDIPEPVYTPESVTVEHHLNLLIYDGTVQKWVTTKVTNKSINSVDSS